MNQKRKLEASTGESSNNKKRAKHATTTAAAVTTTTTAAAAASPPPPSSPPQKREIPDTSRPTAVFQPNGPRTHTLSVAVPSSIIADAKSHEQKTFLAGTIARAMAVFCVDEVVIFDDSASSTTTAIGAATTTTNINTTTTTTTPGPAKGAEDESQSYTGFTNPSHFLAHLLSYMETPPYLRKALFPMHPNLRTAGTLPSLDLPSHVRSNEWLPYREGIVVAAAPSNGSSNGGSNGISNGIISSSNSSSSNNDDETVEVDVGLPERCVIKTAGGARIPAKTRVTVRLLADEGGEGEEGEGEDRQAEGTATATAAAASTSASTCTSTPTVTTATASATGRKRPAIAVSPATPREQDGYYWGYSVRVSASLSAVLTECPFDGGYDISFGTSERGQPLSEVLQKEKEKELLLLLPSPSPSPSPSPPPPPRYRHLLVVFGGLGGLEMAAANDSDLADRGISARNVAGLFDYWVNLVPGQGSRTIRTEEAVWLGLMGLRGLVMGE